MSRLIETATHEESGRCFEQITGYDFRPHLRDAAAKAPIFDRRNPHDLRGKADIYRDTPDDAVLFSTGLDADSCFDTVDHNEYWDILRQSFDILDEYDGFSFGENQKRFISNIYRHELEHARVAYLFGNSDTSSHLGVKFYKMPHGVLNFYPYHQTMGPMRKVHLAYEAVAPRDPSPSDLVVARGFGYDNLDELKRLAQEIPPVAEGWSRVLSQPAQDLAGRLVAGSSAELDDC